MCLFNGMRYENLSLIVCSLALASSLFIVVLGDW